MPTAGHDKHVRFDASLEQPSVESVDLNEPAESGANSPLKASTILGSTIKKLSPVSGAAQTSEAKVAYARLVQEASLSMFDDGEGDTGAVALPVSSTETPPFYKQQSATPDSATPGGPTHRYESQQYDLSPPMVAAATTRTTTTTTTISAAGAADAGTPNAQQWKGGGGTGSFPEARSVAMSYGDIQSQLHTLQNDFKNAHGTAAPTASTANVRASVDDGMATDLSPSAAAILSEHLNSIELRAASPQRRPPPIHVGESPAASDATTTTITATTTPGGDANISANRDKNAAYWHSPQGLTTDAIGASSSVAAALSAREPVTPAAPHTHSSPMSVPVSVRRALEKPSPINGSHADQQQTTGTTPVKVQFSADSNFDYGRVQIGVDRLAAFAKYLEDLTYEFAPLLQPHMEEEEGIEGGSGIATLAGGSPLARELHLQTYSLDEMEARVFKKHELLLSSGVLAEF